MSESDFKQACKFAATFFSFQYAPTIENLVPGNYGLAEAMVYTLVFDYLWYTEAPSSISHFRNLTRTIFSVEFDQGLSERVASFDRFCRLDTHDSLSDHFIQEFSAAEWVVQIVHAIAGEAEKAVASGHESRKDEDQIAVSSPSCPIIQIDLEGDDVFSAWASDESLQAMESESWPQVLEGSVWDPSSRQKLPVYHGTQHHIHETLGSDVHMRRAQYDLEKHSSAFQGLHGRVNTNQIAPASPALPVVWTGFSPLRCFLWAVFRSEVIGNIYQVRAAPITVQNSWTCHDHRHFGVALLKFNPSIPPNTNTFILKAGQEAAWHLRRRQVDVHTFHGMTLQQIWGRFSDFHQNNPSTWPEVLHCKEFGDQASMLAPRIRQLWRTVWSGSMIQTLNASHQATYAITVRPKRTVSETMEAYEDCQKASRGSLPRMNEGH